MGSGINGGNTEMGDTEMNCNLSELQRVRLKYISLAQEYCQYLHNERNRIKAEIKPLQSKKTDIEYQLKSIHGVLDTATKAVVDDVIPSYINETEEETIERYRNLTMNIRHNICNFFDGPALEKEVTDERAQDAVWVPSEAWHGE